MSAFDDVPEWAPRNLPEPGGPESPYTFLGASQPTGLPPRRAAGGREDEPFDAFSRPGRSARPPGPARITGSAHHSPSPTL
ncbi:hypothetical protein [Actinomadura sp. NPDC049753]|uniref:hypothetical protein n=1 Tax=Actinomadura sp. NPDC049753 TaxID=3154739 RepID=UPI00343F76E7